MSAQTSQGVAARTVAMEAAPDRKKPGPLDRIADHLRRYWQLWILSAPALFFVGLFSYVAMWGIQLAFREFDPTKGLTGGKFVGFKYFLEFFHNPLFGEIMTNTIRISLWTLVMGFIFPIILALLINQIGSKKIKGFVQTITYMPHFISVVVIVSMLNIFLTPGTGILGRFFGDESLMGSTSAITAVYWISEVWQHVGWNSIIYLAALAGVDTSLYEAAKIDGAGRLQLAEHAVHRSHRHIHLQNRYYQRPVLVLDGNRSVQHLGQLHLPDHRECNRQARFRYEHFLEGFYHVCNN